MSTQEMLHLCSVGEKKKKATAMRITHKRRFLNFVLKEHLPSSGSDFQSCINKTNSNERSMAGFFLQLIVIYSICLVK